jgi:hypothetical protein
MKLSPKAQRFVAEALRDLPPGIDRDRLRDGLSRISNDELPAEYAPLALTALQRFETWLKECLKDVRHNEEKEADLINDIRFIQSVEKLLVQAGFKPAIVQDAVAV